MTDQEEIKLKIVKAEKAIQQNVYQLQKLEKEKIDAKLYIDIANTVCNFLSKHIYQNKAISSFNPFY